MKTKSVRAKTEDAAILEQVSRELAAELQRKISVSDLIHGLMEYVDDAKTRIKKDANKIS